ncbi:hypothetical protein HK097_005776, partial [Rhizophlyctis rosea]
MPGNPIKVPGKQIPVPGQSANIPQQSTTGIASGTNSRSKVWKPKHQKKNKWEAKPGATKPAAEPTTGDVVEGDASDRRSKKTQKLRKWRQEQKALRAAVKAAKEQVAHADVENGLDSGNTKSVVEKAGGEPPIARSASKTQTTEITRKRTQRSVSSDETESDPDDDKQTTVANPKQTSASTRTVPSSTPNIDPALLSYTKRKRTKPTPRTPQYQASSSSSDTDDASNPTKKRKKPLSEFKMVWKYNA